MKDLRKMTKGITHSGTFHSDDVMSTAFIRFFNPSIQIERVREYEGEGKDDEIVYDIGMGRFDHHQEVRRMDTNGHPYAAFGLLWEEYGREYLKENGFVNVEEAFQLFRSRYVYKIDQGDNEGYRELKEFSENETIMKCNPRWFEENEEDVEEIQFAKAVKIASGILHNWTRYVHRRTEKHDSSN